MKKGTQKAVQVKSTECWRPDATFDPDFGFITATDGEQYVVENEFSKEPDPHSMIILESLGQPWLKRQSKDKTTLWKIVTD